MFLRDHTLPHSSEFVFCKRFHPPVVERTRIFARDYTTSHLSEFESLCAITPHESLQAISPSRIHAYSEHRRILPSSHAITSSWIRVNSNFCAWSRLSNLCERLHPTALCEFGRSRAIAPLIRGNSLCAITFSVFDWILVPARDNIRCSIPNLKSQNAGTNQWWRQEIASGRFKSLLTAGELHLLA